MPSSDTKPGIHFPAWLKLLLLGAAVIGLCLGILHVLGRASAARWDRYAARIRASGQPLTFTDIEARRSRLSDELNGARVIEALSAALGEMGADKWSTDKAVLLFGRDPADIDFFAGIPGYRIEPSRRFLEQHRKLLESLAELRDMPTGRMELPLDASPFDIVLPELTIVRSAARLVYLDGAVALVDDDPRKAVDASRVLANLSGTLDQHPTVIGRLVQISIDALVAHAIEDTLRVRSDGDNALSEFENLIDTRLAAGTMKWAFLGERAFFVAVCEQVAVGKISVASLGGATGPPLAPSILPEFLVRENQMRGVEMLTWLVDAADDPAAMTQAARRINRDVSALPVTQLVARIMLPSLSRAVELHLHVTAELHGAQIALAAERFRLENGRLPDSLGHLVPAYLGAVPSDPFDGQPMRLATTDQGIVIYSIGENLVDDGGSVVRPKPQVRSLDVGFRLLKAERRGLLLTDETPPSDE